MGILKEDSDDGEASGGQLNEGFKSEEPLNTEQAKINVIENDLGKCSKGLDNETNGASTLTPTKSNMFKNIYNSFALKFLKPSTEPGQPENVDVMKSSGNNNVEAKEHKRKSIDESSNGRETSHLRANMIANFTTNFNKEGDSTSPVLSHVNEAFDHSTEEVLDKSTSDEIGQKALEIQPPKLATGKPILWTQVFGAVSSATVHLAVGCIVGYTGVTLPSLMDEESDDLVLDKYEASIFSSIVNIGAMVGSILSSLMMTWLGQRSTLLVYLPIGMVFWITMAFARSLWLLILSRVVQGVVMGVCAGCANNYVVETVHKDIRGRLFALIDMCRQIGFLFMYVVGSSQLSWRAVALICGLISLALPFTGMIFLPHSPRWLAFHGRKSEARKALLFFRGADYDVDSEFNDILEQLDKSSKGTKVFDQLKMLTERSIAIRFFILAVLLFASHFTGNFALISYSVSIFESAGVKMNPYLSTVIVACARIVGIIIYMTIADRFGRRPLFMIPLFLSGISMVALGFFFYIKTIAEDISFISWLPLTSIIFYVILTMMSHPVLMLLRSELLPTSVRSVGVGLLYLFFFCGSFGVSISYPYMVDSVGSHWTFWMYGATSFTMVLITAISIPETQGKSLEDIGNLFDKKKVENGA